MCKVCGHATELGYHDAPRVRPSTKPSVYTSMMIGSVNDVPADHGEHRRQYTPRMVLQCIPDAISKVTDKDGQRSQGSILELPSGRWIRTISKHSLYMNQGTVRPVMVRFGHSDWLTGVKSFGKSGTSEDLAVSGGSFIPNQIAAFAVVGVHRTRTPNRISQTLPSTAGYNSYWLVRHRGSGLPTSFIANSKKNIPIDNDSGLPSRSTPRLASMWALRDELSAWRHTTSEWQQQSQAANSSVARRTLGKTSPKPGPNSGQCMRPVLLIAFDIGAAGRLSLRNMADCDTQIT